MEIFSNNSKNIIKLIAKFQNNKIDRKEFNKNVLINTIITYNSIKKKNKNYIKLKKEQNEIFQSFFIQEQKQEENEKELLSKIRDRQSKRIVIEAIKEQREALLKGLSSQKNIKSIAEHTFNSYIPPKNISLSLNYELEEKTKKEKSKKYLSESNLEINYINPNYNDKIKIISNDFIEPPYIDDEFPDNNDISEENENGNFLKIINEEDEYLFYDEKLQKNEKPSLINCWDTRLKQQEIIDDFEELTQKRERSQTTKVNMISVVNQENIFKKEMNTYLKSNNTILYDEISQKDHFHEFAGFLSEKCYKNYMKKMNYSYLILMLLSYFDFEQFSNNFEFLEDSQAVIIFIKKILLFCGISASKIYDHLIRTVSNNKGNVTFENFLNFFLPIFDLSETYQYYKYSFLLYLVKKSGYNTISMSNYRLFCNLIKGKLIYEDDTCADIIGKMLPIIKVKYPKDDLDNLDYQHVSIILEFLVNYEYGH